jgi:hypothetical protein
MTPTLKFSDDIPGFIRTLATYGYRAVAGSPKGASSWPKRVARLKTWSGQQSLGDLVRERINCMMPWAGRKSKKARPKSPESATPDKETIAEPPPPEKEKADPKSPPPWHTMPAVDYESSLAGVSGVIPGHAAINAIDMGFSPNGLKIGLHPWIELLVLIGVEFAPIAVIPSSRFQDGLFAVYGDGLWYSFFRRVRVDPYYYAWDCKDSRGLLPHQFAKFIDPYFQVGPFDDLQIPEHLLRNPDLLANEISRLTRILNRQGVPA